MISIFLTNITIAFVHINSFALHPVLSLFSFPLLHYPQAALQAAQPVLHRTRLFRVRSEQCQQDTYQHQAGKSNCCSFCSGGLVSHHQSKKPERQDSFHNPEHAPHHLNQQTENDGQHPVANESHQTPLGNCSHTLWSEVG